jgi:hypothetical protein
LLQWTAENGFDMRPQELAVSFERLLSDLGFPPPGRAGIEPLLNPFADGHSARVNMRPVVNLGQECAQLPVRIGHVLGLDVRRDPPAIDAVAQAEDAAGLGLDRSGPAFALGLSHWPSPHPFC